MSNTTSKKLFKNVIAEKIIEGISSTIGNLFTLAITLIIGGYYLHNVYQFNSDKQKFINKIQRPLSQLRNEINNLSATVAMKNDYKNIDSYNKDVKKIAKNIANLEIKISNDGMLFSYYFGEDLKNKVSNFLTWSNQISTLILEKKYSPPENLADKFYYSIMYSTQLQIYNPYHCSQCLKLANKSPSDLLLYIEKLDTNYPKLAMITNNDNLTQKEIRSMSNLASKIYKKK